jgi:hypothetical protein
MLDVVSHWCKQWRLEVNVSKTKVMVFGVRGTQNTKARCCGRELEEVEEYKYLGVWLSKGGWKKAKDFMARKARRAGAMAWSLAMRAADMSVKGMISVWQALIRPHLEYAAEVLDGKWEEAEAIQRQAGRRVLKVGMAVGNAAVIGELGWISMAGRRALLRLNYWEKVLAMPEGRLPKRVYQRQRKHIELGHSDKRWWAQRVKSLLSDLGLGQWWDRQEVCPHWSDEVRDKIHAKETERWRSDCAKNRKLEEYVLVKNELRREEYLGYGDAAVRRIFTKARTGAVELRLETGRWESLLVAGKQLQLPRQYRTCRLCEEEVEDLRHWLFVCPAYSVERQAFMRVCSGVLAGDGWARVRRAAEEILRGERAAEKQAETDLLKWVLSGEGQHGGTCMEFVRNMWVKREYTRIEMGFQ